MATAPAATEGNGKSPPRRIVRRLAAVLACLVALTGCGWGVPLRKPELVTQQEASRATIRPGESTRAEVREILGEPWLASRYWRTEVYRVSDKRTEAQGFFILVLPIPMGVFTAKLRSYVLVAYDDEDRVSQVASAVGSASRSFKTSSVRSKSVEMSHSRWAAAKAGRSSSGPVRPTIE